MDNSEDWRGERLPVIGIPAARQDSHADGYTFQKVGAPYAEALEQAGACAILLPVTQNGDVIRRQISILDAILLPGGGDIAPHLYGEQPTVVVGVDEDTDRYELELCRQCLEADIPILAVCRGAQILNVALGGTLIQDIPTEINTLVNHRQAASREICTHGILVEPDTALARILGQVEFEVNSFHHQAIDRPGEGLRVVARSREDGIIEGVELSGKRHVIGVQFHPEEICHHTPPTAELFRSLVEAARSYRREPAKV